MIAGEISPQALAARLAAGEPTLLIDVRQPWEHAIVALPGSRLVPLDQLPQRHAEIDAPPGALVVAYCHHGVRSVDAAMFLSRAGHVGVVSLVGGIDAWSRLVDPSLARY
jgi:adenylyltransferase/sulfurtransferase